MTTTDSSKAKKRCMIYRECPALFSRQKLVLRDKQLSLLQLILMWKPMGRICLLAAHSTPSAIATGQSENPLHSLLIF